eukprot:TRINITY_DN1087_c2_g1_i3.p2 TRINITY_DN1087_c2_g1~~TRINITY_DN1087_c2_g1_i3.p2  ORF type:complete len:139 (-),score=27.17 TRINITY_DN1087_c2_g1_i3:262-678(-)
MARPKRRSTSKSNGSSSRRQQPEQDTANENYYNPSDSFIEAKTRSADTDDDGSSDEGETGATMEQSVFDLNVGDSSSARRMQRGSWTNTCSLQCTGTTAAADHWRWNNRKLAVPPFLVTRSTPMPFNGDIDGGDLRVT